LSGSDAVGAAGLDRQLRAAAEPAKRRVQTASSCAAVSAVGVPPTDIDAPYGAPHGPACPRPRRQFPAQAPAHIAWSICRGF
jgi:hypothetical protein